WRRWFLHRTALVSAEQDSEPPKDEGHRELRSAAVEEGHERSLQQARQDDPRMNTQTNDKARFCPACGGADVKASPLAGGDASCNICNWKGKVEELATFHFSHDMGGQEETFKHFFNDMRAFLSMETLAIGLGAVLM